MSDKPKDDDWGMTMPHMRLEKDSNADDYSDEFVLNPQLARSFSDDEWGATQQNFNLPQNQSPSSDFDKTTPNINIPRDVWEDDNPLTLPSRSQQSSHDDWGMTQHNINLPQEPKSDGWGMTQQNFNLPQNQSPSSDFDKTTPNINIPQQNIPPQNNAGDWGMTAPNINISPPPPPVGNKPDSWAMPTPVFRISEGEKVDNLPKRTPNVEQNDIGYDKTVANINFSEVSPPGIYGAPSAPTPLPVPANVSEPPPVETVQTAAPPKSGGSSKMIYALAGLIVFLFLGIVALAGVYFLILDKPPSAQTTEAPKEEAKESVTSAAPATSAPVVSNTTSTETVLPNAIEYKGAMVLVKAGEFSMGSDADADESKPAHKVTLPAFYIDKTEVTNAEYKKFCDETGKSYPPDPHLEKNYFTNRPNAPVVGVSFADAKAYAVWAGKRLPTEEEWEKAASWDEAKQTKKAFPWGDDFQKSNVAFGLSSISDVGKFSGGASPSGALDMAGNVFEWVDAFFQPYPGSPSKNAEFGEKNRIVRGGHFASKSNDSLKTTKRIYIPADIASGEDGEKLIAAIIGFRCAVSADDSKVKEVLQSQSK